MTTPEEGIKTIEKIVYSADWNKDRSVLLGVRAESRTFSPVAIEHPKLVSIEFEDTEVFGFIKAVRELEDIKWEAQRFHSETRLVYIGNAPVALSKHSEGTYFFQFAGCVCHYTTEQILSIVDSLDEAYRKSLWD